MKKNRKKMLPEFIVLSILMNMLFTGVIKQVTYAAAETIKFYSYISSQNSVIKGVDGSNLDVLETNTVCLETSLVINDIDIIDSVIPNTAPKLKPVCPVLTSITEDDISNFGQGINSFAVTSISDIDSGAVKGIAIVAISNQNGTWQYSINGVAWNTIGFVSLTNALLLRDVDKVRFVPDGKGGTATPATISYKAWDQTSGTYGAKVNCTSSGANSAFSINFDVASISIINVNDAPMINSAGYNFTQISERDINNSGNKVTELIGSSVVDVDTGALKGIAIMSTVGGNGKWQYSTDNGLSWSDVGIVDDANSLLLRSSDKVRFVPNGISGTAASITYRAWDRTSGTYGRKLPSYPNEATTAYSVGYNTANITVDNINYAPTLTSVANLVGVDKTNIITYADLAAAADEADSDGDTISFRIEVVNKGNLLKNVSLPVNTGVTTIGPGESLSWTVPNNTNGLVDAFIVKAFDGTAASNTDVQVKVNIQDTTQPLILGANVPPVGTYLSGSTLSFEVFSNEVLYVTEGATGKPYLEIKLGKGTAKEKIVRALYVSGSGSNTLNFVYTIISGDSSGEYQTELVSKVQLNNCAIKDVSGNEVVLDFSYYDLSKVIVDTVAPVWTDGYPKSDIISADSIKVVMQSIDESGIAYYVCVPNNSKEPSVAQVKAGQDASGNLIASNFRGSSSVNKSVDTFFTVNSLAVATDYDIYIVVEDAYGNIVKTAKKIDVKTKTIPITNFSISSKTATTINFTWASAIGASGIIIEKSLASVENWVPAVIGPLAPNANMSKVTVLAANTAYKFRLIVTGGANEGFSNVITETTNQVPLVTSVIGPLNRTYKIGDVINFKVIYDKDIVISEGTPSLKLTIGSAEREASYSSGSGSNELTFAYTVEDGDKDTDGVQISSAVIDLNGATIKNTSNENADLNITVVQDFSGVLVDTKAPTVISIMPPTNRRYKLGDSLLFIVNFDEKVYFSGNEPTIRLTIGSKSVDASYQSGSETTAINFIYTVTSGEIDEDVILVDSNITLNGSTIKDYAGNNAVVNLSGVSTSAVLIDAVAPKFVASEISADKKNITLKFNENISDVATSLLENSVYLSTNGGMTYRKFSSLANKGAISISGKDLIVALTTPLEGSKNKIKIIENSIKDLFENVKTDATETEDFGTSILVAMDEPFTEENLNERVLSFNVEGESFKDATLDKNNFIINNAPKGVTVKSITYTDSTNCLLTLSYDGSDMDYFISNVSITVLGSELTKGEDIKTNNIVIKVMDDPEAISIKTLSTIKEREEDKKVITVIITGGQFADSLNKDNWAVTNLPVGVTVGSVTKINANTAEIVLAGNSTGNYDSDISDVTVSCGTSEYNDSTGGRSLTASSGVTFVAKTTGTVATYPVVSVGKTTATLSGNVTIPVENNTPGTSGMPTTGSSIDTKVLVMEGIGLVLVGIVIVVKVGGIRKKEKNK